MSLSARSNYITVGMAVLLVLVLFSGIASAQCVVAASPDPTASSTRVRITVAAFGKPLLGATVKVSETDKPPFLTVSTDDHGLAVLPTLKPGWYTIAVTSGDDLFSELHVHATEHPENKASEFNVNLQPTETAQVLATAERMSVDERVQDFKRAVVDPAGARVPGALIEVYPRGSGSKSKAIQLKADENGRFSAPLADGTYTVVVRMQGFRIWFLLFQIARDGKAKELNASLRIGGCP